MATSATAVLHQVAAVAAVAAAVREAEVFRFLRQALVLLDLLTRIHLHLVPLLARQASAVQYRESTSLQKRHTVQLNLRT